jgi:hypothetical protein
MTTLRLIARRVIKMHIVPSPGLQGAALAYRPRVF